MIKFALNSLLIYYIPGSMPVCIKFLPALCGFRDAGYCAGLDKWHQEVQEYIVNFVTLNCSDDGNNQARVWYCPHKAA